MRLRITQSHPMITVNLRRSGKYDLASGGNFIELTDINN